MMLRSCELHDYSDSLSLGWNYELSCKSSNSRLQTLFLSVLRESFNGISTYPFTVALFGQRGDIFMKTGQ
jgi:hypothetical protein